MHGEGGPVTDPAGRTVAPLPPALAGAIAAHEQAFSGTLALWVCDLVRREAYGLRAHETLRPASTVKLFVLHELFRQAEAGGVRLDDTVELRARDIVPGTGVLKNLTPSLRISVGDAAMLMITVSDNVATNLLIDRLGTAAINRGARDAGCHHTVLSGRLFRRRAAPSMSTPRDLGTLMVRIATRSAVSRSASAAMLDILRREPDDTIVGRYLPGGGPWRPWRVASKSGSLDGIRNDVALVEGNGVRYAIALMSRDSADHRYHPDNEATLCLARVARLVHDHVARDVVRPAG